MADGGEIEAALELVVEIGLRVGLLGAREHMMRQRDLVDRVRHLVLDRRKAAQIGDDRVQVAGREDRVERRRHDLGNLVAVRMLAGHQQRLDLVVGPIADAGFLVRRDVGRGDVERRLVEAQAAGIILAGGRRRRPLRRMAIGAGHDGVHQIAAALDRGLRERRRRSRSRPQQIPTSNESSNSPSSLGIESAAMISWPCDSANRGVAQLPTATLIVPSTRAGGGRGCGPSPNSRTSWRGRAASRRRGRRC